MGTIRKIVETEVYLTDNDDQILNTEGKVYDPTNPKEKPELSKEKYFLLHWGLDTVIQHNEDGSMFPVTKTMGVCEHCENGHIRLMEPELLKVVGIERR